jgi:2-oxoglutarate dehydrogenase E2 component (dihydrolipoamide succinyltransferase)
VLEEGAVAAAPAAKAAAAPAAAPAAAAKAAAPAAAAANDNGKLAPSVRRMVEEKQLDPSKIPATAATDASPRVMSSSISTSRARKPRRPRESRRAPATAGAAGRQDQRVPMTRLRARIAERLLEAQQTQAQLTTFNEIDLKAVMDLRAKYKDGFEKKHGVKLGFMSFFVKAAVEALKKFPTVNASIEGNDIVYHEYYDIGVAVSTEKGLMVPVLRDADLQSYATSRRTSAFATRARDGKITIDELTGGTFSITNGGTFGSLLSTPIVNMPQSAILGMHKTMERPVVVNGEIVIRPMMYVALSYDHRIIDGREAVQFLVTIKDCLEDPARCCSSV